MFDREKAAKAVNRALAIPDINPEDPEEVEAGILPLIFVIPSVFRSPRVLSGYLELC